MKKLRLYKALAEQLGPVSMVRFLQFETGYDDYTAEREVWQKNLDEEVYLEQVLKQEGWE